jgi:hypothetical protein
MTTSITWRPSVAIIGVFGVAVALVSLSRACTRESGPSTAETAFASTDPMALSRQMPKRAAEPTAPMRFEIDEGRFVMHDVTLKLDEAVAAFGAMGGETRVTTTIVGRVRLDGQRPAHAGERAARLSFTNLEALSVVVNGQEVVDDTVRDAFAHDGVLIAFAANGRPISVAAERGAHELFVRVSQLFIAHAFLRFADDDMRSTTTADGVRYDVIESIPDGTLAASYVLTRTATDTFDVVKTVRQTSTRVPGADISVRPAMVSGYDRASLHRRGVVLSRDADLTRAIVGEGGGILATSSLQLRMTLADEGASSVVVAAVDHAMAPEALLMNEERAQEVSMRQRIEGLTREKLVDTLRVAAQSGTAPDHNRFLWRATGLLRTDDEALAALEPLFADPTTTVDGRALLLDLATGAGTPKAQRTLLAWLESDAIANTPRAAELRQRLTFVTRPTEQTLAFLVEKSKGEGSWQEPARMSLGAASAHLARAGRFDDADRIAAALLAMPVRDARAEVVLIKAIGNTARPVVENRIVRAARDRDPDLRHAAAGALRHLETEAARKALLDLTTDQSPLIAARAMVSLGKQRVLTSEERATLASAVALRRVPDLALAELVTLVAPLVDDIAVRDLLRSILLLEKLEDPNVKARIRGLLSAQPMP